MATDQERIQKAVAAVEALSSAAPKDAAAAPPAGEAPPPAPTDEGQETAAPETPPTTEQPPTTETPPPVEGEQPADPPQDERWTQLYSRLSEMDSAMRALRQENARLRQGAPSLDSQRLQQMSIRDRLSLVGLSNDEVLDDWASTLGVVSGDSAQTPAPDGTLRELQRVKQELAELRQQTQRQGEQNVRQRVIGEFVSAIQANQDRWPLTTHMAKTGGNALELAADIAKEMFALQQRGEFSGEITHERVLDAAENYYSQTADTWAKVAELKKKPAKTPAAAASQQDAKPATKTIGTQKDGTPTPRPKTEKERLKAAASVLERRLREREAQD